MSKHSPGPWHVYVTNGQYIGDAENISVATCLHHARVTQRLTGRPRRASYSTVSTASREAIPLDLGEGPVPDDSGAQMDLPPMGVSGVLQGLEKGDRGTMKVHPEQLRINEWRETRGGK